MKYSIIYADPPWTYRDKAAAGERGAGFKYGLMSTSELVALRVAEVTSPNATCFMWATMPLLQEALTLMAAWGFEYKTCAFCWVKLNRVASTPFFGMGNWTRSNAELCLLGVRGKPKRVDASISMIVQAPIGAHSAKPLIVRDKIVQLMGDLPRLEMFARDRAPGWDVFGDQVEGSIGL